MKYALTDVNICQYDLRQSTRSPQLRGERPAPRRAARAPAPPLGTRAAGHAGTALPAQPWRSFCARITRLSIRVRTLATMIGQLPIRIP